MNGPKNLHFYLNDLSNAIGTPRYMERSIVQERKQIDSYFTAQDSKWLKIVQKKADTLPPMQYDVRVVIFIPARFEEKRIEVFLNAIQDEITNSNLCTLSNVEMLLLDNWFSGERPDQTECIVENWKKRHKGASIKIHYLQHIWSKEEIYPLAKARKLLVDIALYRSIKRLRSKGPLYLLTEDADTMRIQWGRTAKMLVFLDAQPTVDVVCGVEERDRKAMGKNHLLLLDRKSWYFAESILSSGRYRPDRWKKANFYWNRIVTPGANACFSAEVYALVGGYTRDVRLFEDMDLGQRISVVRGMWRRNDFIPDVDTIRRINLREESSAARFVIALSNLNHPYDSGHGFGLFFDKRVEEMSRCWDIDSLLSLIRQWEFMSKLNKWRFEYQLSEHLFEISKILDDQIPAREIFSRVMWLLGFEKSNYEIFGTKVQLRKFDNFICLAKTFSKYMVGPYACKKYCT